MLRLTLYISIADFCVSHVIDFSYKTSKLIVSKQFVIQRMILSVISFFGKLNILGVRIGLPPSLLDNQLPMDIEFQAGINTDTRTFLDFMCTYIYK